MDKGTCGPHLKLIYIYIRGRSSFGSGRMFFLFFLFSSLLFDTQSFDRQNSSGQEQKFIYSTRATREY